MQSPEEISLEEKTKKSLVKKWWKRVLATLGVLAVITGIFESVYVCTEFWHEYNILKEIVISEDYETRISDLEDYVHKKSKSFAVGFRVFKEVDEITEKVIYKKKYRDWRGTWNDIFYDEEASELYGVDYYFYYHKDTGEKIYCW
jgi:hypothetical protein